MRLILTMTAAALACTPALAQLDPPEGPVEPTFKTLDQVEPSTPIGPDTTPGDEDSVFRIMRAGAYHLTDNIQVDAPGKHVIEISVYPVTLDLRGFTIKALSHDMLSVIYSRGTRWQVIRNGAVQGLSGGDGIDLENAMACRIENVIVNGGIRAIDAGNQAVVRNCTVLRAHETGIYAGSASLIEGCTLADGPAPDANGIETGEASIIRDTAIEWRGNIGVVPGKDTRIIDCTFTNSDFAGIYVSDGAHITGCTITNGDGFGIYALNDAVIEGCKVSGCAYDGIRVYNRCRVVNNTCDSNGAAQDGAYAGIVAYGDANTINDNTCRENYVYGVFIASALNTVLRNHAINNDDDFRVLAPDQNHWPGEIRPGQSSTNANVNYRD